MPTKPPLKGPERAALMNALYEKYAKKKTWGQHLTYLRKKYFWLLFVGGASLFKRFFDIIISIGMIVVSLPLFLIIALAIKLYDRGPIFYTANRVGKWGKEFRFVKFRTMEINADKKIDALQSQNIHLDPGTFKMKEDPRITPVGKILRRMSLDELPQLWCVLKGDMSLVGPRPPLPREVAHYTLNDRRRLDIKPGITCIWQVSGRSEIPFNKQVQLDLEYIESQSLWLDIVLLLKTIPAVLFGRGAY
ncbi:MAG: sugar transferase [Parachlamydiales bacterium]|jgi:lipopolysaccharide/colanic/teichoic acid biosynthesis glycosyltransferase